MATFGNPFTRGNQTGIQAFVGNLLNKNTTQTGTPGGSFAGNTLNSTVSTFNPIAGAALQAYRTSNQPSATPTNNVTTANPAATNTPRSAFVSSVAGNSNSTPSPYASAPSNSSPTAPSSGTQPSGAPSQNPVTNSNPLGTNSSSPDTSLLGARDAYISAFKNYGNEQTQTQQQLNNFNLGNQQGIANIRSRVEPITDITGQLASQARNAGVQQQALNSNISLQDQQAKNQLDAAQAMYQTQSDALTSLPYGSSIYNKFTGETTGGISPEDQTMVGQALADGRITTADITRYGLPSLIQSLKLDPNYNSVAIKAGIAADTDSLKQQQTYADTTTRAVNNAQTGINQLLTKYSGKINDSSITIANAIQNAIKYQLSPNDISSFKGGLQEVSNEYTQVFSRGGQISDARAKMAHDILDGNISLSALKSVSDELQAQGKIVVDGANQQIQTIQDRLKNSQASNTNNAGSTTNNPIQTNYGTIDPSL